MIDASIMLLMIQQRKYGNGLTIRNTELIKELKDLDWREINYCNVFRPECKIHQIGIEIKNILFISLARSVMNLTGRFC